MLFDDVKVIHVTGVTKQQGALEVNKGVTTYGQWTVQSLVQSKFNSFWHYYHNKRDIMVFLIIKIPKTQNSTSN